MSPLPQRPKGAGVCLWLVLWPEAHRLPYIYIYIYIYSSLHASQYNVSACSGRAKNRLPFGGKKAIAFFSVTLYNNDNETSEAKGRTWRVSLSPRPYAGGYLKPESHTADFNLRPTPIITVSPKIINGKFRGGVRSFKRCRGYVSLRRF